MTAVVVAVAALVGYACGAVSPAAIVARVLHGDLRAGSGNPGATNVGRVLGVRWGVLVAVLDIAKGAAPAAGFATVGEVPGLVAGAAAVLGHVTSPFLRGRGGRGVATSLGAVLGVHPLLALAPIGAFVLVVAATRWVALSSIAAALALAAVVFVVDASAAARVWAVALAALVLVRHRSNIRAAWRLRRGRSRR